MKKTFLIIIIIATNFFHLYSNDNSYSNDVSHSPWHIVVHDTTRYIGVSLANGRIGIKPSVHPFQTGAIYLNNIYDKESEFGVSKLLKGINFANLDIEIDGERIDKHAVSGWLQDLNMHEATLTTSFRVGNKAHITYTLIALRGMPYAGMIDVKITALTAGISLSVYGKIICPGEYVDVNQRFTVLRDAEIEMPILQTVARSPFGRHTLSTTASFLFDNEFPKLDQKELSAYEHQLGFSKELGQGERYSFAWSGAVCSTGDFYDPRSESERMVVYLMRGNKHNVISQHKSLWEELWQGDIIVEGDPKSQQDIRLALYHLYAFSRADSDLSIAPMGQSSQIYNGHVFWDTELWMFPPLLIFNHGIAASLLNYRVNRMDKARQKARNYGYDGVMFPWESDDTGEEATPTWALTGTFQHHITADVGIAFWNYYRATGDKLWLKETGWPVLREVADFWVSRSTQNTDGSYSILNVVGANEFAPNVDDNAFTNGSAKTILEYATQAAQVLDVEAGELWQEVADKLRFYHFDNGVIKENATYSGERIKQADVNLLSFPLEVVTDPGQMERDLLYYQERMAEEGPAMGHAILSVIYAHLGDCENAFALFKRSFEPNKRPPFGALAETAWFDNTYFATAAGGLLQAVIFGFGGLQISNEGIIQGTPCLPPNWTKLEIKGVHPGKKSYVIERQ